MRSVRKSQLAALAVTGALAIPAAAVAGTIRPGDTTSGLGLLGPSIPDVLKQAKADPYLAPGSCAAIAEEVAALDEVLGPDADAPAQKAHFDAGRLLGRTVRGLIPHRDIVRFITGAGRKEKALSDAAMAGWARRGYLKGVARQMDCAGAAAEVAAASPAGPVAATGAAVPALETGEVTSPPPSDPVLLRTSALAAPQEQVHLRPEQ